MSISEENSINFVSMKSFIKTVESNLLGADIGEAVRWIKKFFYPDGYNSFRFRYRREPVDLIMFNEDESFSFAPEKMTNHLLSMAVDFPLLFNESCYNKFGFIKEKLEAFFEERGVKLDFNSTDFCDLNLGSNKKDKQIKRLKEEVEYLKSKLSKNNSNSVLHLNKFRNDDPLALAINIRNKEWACYVHDDKTTRGNQESIVLDLVNKGLSKKQAESIELVACPIKR